jgi:Ca-activated chloride channel homolog
MTAPASIERPSAWMAASLGSLSPRAQPVRLVYNHPMIRMSFVTASLTALFSVAPIGAFQPPFSNGPITLTSHANPRPPAGPEGVLRVDSSLVLIPVHVTNPAGASVTSLGKESFRLSEDGVEQRLTNFGKDDAPVSVGLLFDASGSMRNKMKKSSEAVAAFFRTANPEDEFFLVRFNDAAKLAVPFTQDTKELEAAILRTKPFGHTSLLDSIHLALLHMKQARNPRRALVIFSDGGDNWSRHTVRQIKSALMEADIQIYAMGIFDTNYLIKHTAEERRGPKLLDELAAQTGGRHYPVTDLNDLPAISARIGRDLREQYVLGYYSTNPLGDGQYRRVKLSLVDPSEALQLRVYYKQGYSAPVH